MGLPEQAVDFRLRDDCPVANPNEAELSFAR